MRTSASNQDPRRRDVAHPGGPDETGRGQRNRSKGRERHGEVRTMEQEIEDDEEECRFGPTHPMLVGDATGSTVEFSGDAQPDHEHTDADPSDHVRCPGNLSLHIPHSHIDLKGVPGVDDSWQRRNRAEGAWHVNGSTVDVS